MGADAFGTKADRGAGRTREDHHRSGQNWPLVGKAAVAGVRDPRADRSVDRIPLLGCRRPNSRSRAAGRRRLDRAVTQRTRERANLMQTIPLDQSVSMIPDGASLMIG